MDRLKHCAAIRALGENLRNQKRNGKRKRIFFFTLKFDAVGKWEMVRTREVPPKGVGGLNAEERKEINRIEKKDRELRSK